MMTKEEKEYLISRIEFCIEKTNYELTQSPTTRDESNKRMLDEMYWIAIDLWTE